MREALKLADLALSGANMNMAVVKRKIVEALALSDQMAIPDERPVPAATAAMSQFNNGWNSCRAEMLGVSPTVKDCLTVPAALIEAARAVVQRWDSPLWKQAEHTGEFIHRLRMALDAVAAPAAPEESR